MGVTKFGIVVEAPCGGTYRFKEAIGRDAGPDFIDSSFVQGPMQATIAGCTSFLRMNPMEDRIQHAIVDDGTDLFREWGRRGQLRPRGLADASGSHLP